jgi:hypothetical protein
MGSWSGSKLSTALQSSVSEAVCSSWARQLLTAGFICSQLAATTDICSSRTYVKYTKRASLCRAFTLALCNVQDVVEQLQHLQLRNTAVEELQFTGSVLLVHGAAVVHIS